MRAILLSIAAAAALTAPAEARSVSLTDFFAGETGALSIRGARISMTAPEPLESLSRAELRDAALMRCTGPRDNFCGVAPPSERLQGAMLTIFLEEGFSLSKLSFSGFPAESAFSRNNPSVIVNGVSYTLDELAALTLSGGRIEISLDSLAAAGLSLRSFELTDLSTPLPAAGLLMLAGLGGFAAARSLRKKA